MNKVLITAITASLLLGFSQVGEAKEHNGPKADRGSSYSSHSARDRGSRAHNSNRGHDRRADRGDRRADRDRGQQRHRGDRDRRHRRDASHGRYRDHDRHQYRDRHRGHRGHYRGHNRHRYYKHYHPRTYPRNVYYLGQDWYYYGGYYHPFPRYHVHTRYCHHRYWEPLAVGLILGTVLGW